MTRDDIVRIIESAMNEHGVETETIFPTDAEGRDLTHALTCIGVHTEPDKYMIQVHEVRK